MDNIDIDLADYVAIYWVNDTATTGHIEWKRADYPHPHYAMYVSRYEAVILRRYYGRLVEKQAQHRFDTPLRIIAEWCTNVDAATASTAPFALIGIDEEEDQLVTFDVDANTLEFPARLWRKPVADVVIAVAALDIDVYYQLSAFFAELDAVIWEGYS